MADIYELTVCDDDATITHEGDPAPNTEAREGYYTFNATKTIGDVSEMYSVNLQVTTSKEFRMPIIGDKITAGVRGNTAFFIGYTSLAVINESKIQITEPGPFIPIGDVTSDFQAINVGKITEMINNKMDRDLGNKTKNINYIIESAETATDGYNVYSNGYYEEWGCNVGTLNGWQTILLHKTFKTYPTVVVSRVGPAGDDGNTADRRHIMIRNLTSNSFQVWGIWAGYNCNFIAKGFLAEGQY